MINIPGQISFLDIVEHSQGDITEEYLKEVVLRGTSFVNGKKRVYQFYQETMTATERAQRIKKEYGLGGAGWPLDGYGLHGYDTYLNGIKIQYRTELGEHEKIFAWKQVEEVIHRLVDSGQYYEPPKKRRCAATNKDCNHENCKKVAIECLDIDCKAECCQACTENCGARCNYSAHQPKVLKEKKDFQNQTWIENPNYKRPDL